MTAQPLPIDGHLLEILGTCQTNVVVTATPGSGKTTRIPPALAERVKGRVLCVEPRRLACIGAASRIAEEHGEKLGDRIGYEIRQYLPYIAELNAGSVGGQDLSLITALFPFKEIAHCLRGSEVSSAACCSILYLCPVQIPYQPTAAVCSA